MSKRKRSSSRNAKRKRSKKGQVWGEKLKTLRSQGLTYYKNISINNEQFEVGNFVSVLSQETKVLTNGRKIIKTFYNYGKINLLFEDSKSKEKKIQVRYYELRNKHKKVSLPIDTMAL